MLKEEYNKLELEIIEFEVEDIITASPPGINDPNTPGGGWSNNP